MGVPWFMYAKTMTDVNLLQDTDEMGERPEKDKEKQGGSNSVTLTNPHTQNAPESFNNGGAVRSILRRVSSAFQRNSGRSQPARILHAQYHDGTPAPHIAPPPQPDANKTSSVAVGSLRKDAQFSLQQHREKEGVIQQPPLAHTKPESMPDAKRSLQRTAHAVPQLSAAKPVVQEVGKKGARKMTQGTPTTGEPPTPGVNLVPEELQSAAGSRNKLVMLGLTAAITVLVIGIVSVGLLLVQQMLTKKADAIKSDIAAMDSQRTKLTAQKRSAIQLHKDTLQAIDILNKHIYWTQFFKQLEAVTIDVVQYKSVTADRAGRVTILASGPDFRSVARQLIAYQQDAAFIKDVSITSASVRQGVGVESFVDFTATLTLQPGAVLLPAPTPAVAVPTTTSPTTP